MDYIVTIERQLAELAEAVEKRDAAVMPTTKAIYQAFIDDIDRIKEKLNGGVIVTNIETTANVPAN